MGSQIKVDFNPSRRNFIQGCAAAVAVAALSRGTAAAALAADPSGLIKPPALKPGDTIGVITPARFMRDPDKLLLVERTLTHFGLKTRFAGNVGKQEGFVGGTVDERLEDLHGLLRDPEIKGIFCIRGGSGTMQLLDRIDYKLFRKHPKVFLGYSDITAMHLAIQKHAGLVTFHGPIVLSKFTDYTQENFRKALFDPAPLGALTNPAEDGVLRPNHLLRTIRPGTARGRLIGGNLTLICATMGTPYEIDTKGKILFVEDIDEQPYRIDRMLQHLRLAGKLQQAAGLVIGECVDWNADYKPFDNSVSLGEVIDAVVGRLDIPVLYGLTVGHTPDQLTLPLGLMASLDAGAGTLTIEETATSTS